MESTSTTSKGQYAEHISVNRADLSMKGELCCDILLGIFQIKHNLSVIERLNNHECLLNMLLFFYFIFLEE